MPKRRTRSPRPSAAARPAPPLSSWRDAIFEQSLDAIVAFDTSGRFIDLNPAAELLTGYTRAELLRMSFEDLVVPDQRQPLHASFAQQLAGGTPDVETAVLHKDGSRIELYVTGGRVVDAGGRGVGVYAIAKDITARKLAESAVRETNERLRMILANSLDVIYSRDLKTDRYDCVSPSVEALTGLTPEEFMSGGIASTVDRVHPDDLARSLAAIESALADPAGRGMAEYRYRRKDGVYRWFADHFMVTRDTAGLPAHWIGTVRDITTLKEAEAVLRRSHDELEQRVRDRTAELELALAQLGERDSLLNEMSRTIHQVFWIQDARTGRVLHVSPSFETVWGRPTAELLAAPGLFVDSIHPDDRERVAQFVRDAPAQSSFDLEYRIVRPDGETRWIRDRGFAVRDADGRASRLVGVCDDITERKQLEREIHDVSEREQRRIGQDLHDGLCQTLVGALFGCRILGRQLGETGSPLAEEAGRVEGILHDALTQARAVAKGLSPVDLVDEGLHEALDLLMRSATALFRVDCALKGRRRVSVREPGVALHLYRIAQEAVTNAIKHGQPHKVRVALTAGRDTITLRVEDDGVGMSERLAGQGGMGIHVMQHRARMVDGILVHAARKGGGTVVTCTCPNRAPAHA